MVAHCATYTLQWEKKLRVGILKWKIEHISGSITELIISIEIEVNLLFSTERCIGTTFIQLYRKLLPTRLRWNEFWNTDINNFYFFSFLDMLMFVEYQKKSWVKRRVFRVRFWFGWKMLTLGLEFGLMMLLRPLMTILSFSKFTSQGEGGPAAQMAQSPSASSSCPSVQLSPSSPANEMLSEAWK